MPYPVFINYLQSVRTLQKTYPAAHIYVFTHICNHVTAITAHLQLHSNDTWMELCCRHSVAHLYSVQTPGWCKMWRLCNFVKTFLTLLMMH